MASTWLTWPLSTVQSATTARCAMHHSRTALAVLRRLRLVHGARCALHGARCTQRGAESLLLYMINTCDAVRPIKMLNWLSGGAGGPAGRRAGGRATDVVLTRHKRTPAVVAASDRSAVTCLLELLMRVIVGRDG